MHTHLHQAVQNLTRLFLDKNSDESEDVVSQTLSVISIRVVIQLGRDGKMQPGFVDFPNFAQCIGFASRELFLRPESFENPQGEISPGL